MTSSTLFLQAYDHSERASSSKRTRKVWTPAQLRLFLEIAQSHRLFAFYRLAAYSGARRGELLNLRWRDVDLDGAEIRVTGSASVISRERIEGTTKIGRSRVISRQPTGLHQNRGRSIPLRF